MTDSRKLENARSATRVQTSQSQAELRAIIYKAAADAMNDEARDRRRDASRAESYNDGIGAAAARVLASKAETLAKQLRMYADANVEAACEYNSTYNHSAAAAGYPEFAE